LQKKITFGEKMFPNGPKNGVTRCSIRNPFNKTLKDVREIEKKQREGERENDRRGEEKRRREEQRREEERRENERRENERRENERREEERTLVSSVALTTNQRSLKGFFVSASGSAN
jgi:hypothetical protein